MKIVAYNVVTTHSVTEINKAVKNYMDSGWQPLGGVQVVKDNNRISVDGLVFFQTVVQYGH